MPRILEAVAVMLVAVLLLDVTSFFPGVFRKSARSAGVVLRWSPLVLLAGWLAVVLAGGAGFDELRRNGLALMNYSGPALTAIALGGLALAPFMLRKPHQQAWIVFLAAATLIMLKQKHAVELYPWATKRYLTFAVPLIGISAGWFLAEAVRRLSPRRIWLVPVFAAALCVPGAGLGLDAWRNTEYGGARALLAEVTANIGTNEWVVTDHFTWGTPLSMAYGCHVVDGTRLWGESDAETRRRIWNRLAVLQKNGQSILLVTSTPRGAEIFGEYARGARLRWSSGPGCLSEIRHHKMVRGFPLRTIAPEFRIYEWQSVESNDR